MENCSLSTGIQVHLLFNIGIARRKSFDLRIGQCSLVHIFTGTYRRLACHNLTDEFLLVFNKLPTVRIEGSFRHIAENLNLWIKIPLPQNTPFLLFNVSRSFFADSSYMLSFSVLCSCVCSRLISPSVSSWHKQDNTLMHQSPGHIQRRTPYNF